MRTFRIDRPAGVILLSALAVVFLALAASQEPNNKPKSEKQTTHLIGSLKGPDLFRAYCASCHGVDAKGDGPVAAALIAKTPDLTLIARRNSGVFPEKRLQTIIAGDDTLVAHGSREMPIWGPIFHQIEEDRDYGNIRMKNLIEYLRSIQRK